MKLGRSTIWLPGLVGAGVLFLIYASFLLYVLEVPSPAEVTRTVVKLIPYPVAPILAGTLSAFLAWRMGARRSERVAASLLPAIVVMCFSLYIERDLLRRVPNFTICWFIRGTLYSVWIGIWCLLTGASVFLLPNERSGESRRV